MHLFPGLEVHAGLARINTRSRRTRTPALFQALAPPGLALLLGQPLELRVFLVVLDEVVQLVVVAIAQSSIRLFFVVKDMRKVLLRLAGARALVLGGIWARIFVEERQVILIEALLFFAVAVATLPLRVTLRRIVVLDVVVNKALGQPALLLFVVVILFLLVAAVEAHQVARRLHQILSLLFTSHCHVRLVRRRTKTRFVHDVHNQALRATPLGVGPRDAATHVT